MFYYLFDKAGGLSGPVEFAVTPGIGVQIPSNAVEISFELPPPENGRTWALVNNIPREVIDQRGLVYRKEDGGQQTWNELGELPAAFTKEPWPGDYHVWKNHAWQFDAEAQLNDAKARILAQRDALLRDAVLRIAPLQYAEDIGDASDQEQLELMEWKLYSIELNRIQHQAGFPTAINWPVMPESVA